MNPVDPALPGPPAPTPPRGVPAVAPAIASPAPPPPTAPPMPPMPTPSPAPPMPPAAPEVPVAPVTVIGLADDRLDLLPPEARQALAQAEVVVGGRRHLWLWQSWPGRAPVGPGGWSPETVEVGPDAGEVARTVRQRAMDASRRVCVLAAGDPGFFGIVRALAQMIDRRAMRVLPAPAQVALAFARLSLPWDDALVVSAQGQRPDDLAGLLRTASKVAILTAPEAPPQAIGRALLEAGAAMDLVAVCCGLGTAAEQILETTPAELAAGAYDPDSVVVLLGPGTLPLVGWGPGQGTGAGEGGHGGAPISAQVMAWGLPDSAFAHRAGPRVKPEVRSVVLGKLALPSTGVLWDVGAGSGAVAVECALLRPGLSVLAVEETPEDAARASANSVALGAGVHVVTGRAPHALDGLPAPDRVFLGDCTTPVLDAVLAQLRPGGRVVAVTRALDRAVAAADRLGNLVEVGLGRGTRVAGGGWALAARNPVFVAWGPGGASPEEPDPGEPDPREPDPGADPA